MLEIIIPADKICIKNIKDRIFDNIQQLGYKHESAYYAALLIEEYLSIIEKNIKYPQKKIWLKILIKGQKFTAHIYHKNSLSFARQKNNISIKILEKISYKIEYRKDAVKGYRMSIFLEME